MAFIQDMKELFKDSEMGSSSELTRTKLRDNQDEDNHNDDSSSDSSFRRLTRNYRASENIFSPELTAALEDAAELRGHEGEEIWMPKESSPYAIHKIKSATKWKQGAAPWLWTPCHNQQTACPLCSNK